MRKQVISEKERIRNYMFFCVEWDVNVNFKLTISLCYNVRSSQSS